jgi:hypothetical protein
MINSSNSTIQCSYCAEIVPFEGQECPNCGAPLSESTLSGDLQEHALEELIENSNQDLIKSGTNAAELAFGVGCTLGIIAGGLLMVIIFLAFTRTWTILAVIALILALISFLISSLLASRARDATMRSTYVREIEPDIKRFVTSQGMSQKEFNHKAAQLLPDESLLLAYLADQEN